MWHGVFVPFCVVRKWALGLFVCDLVLYIVFVSTVGAGQGFHFICQLTHSFQTHVTMQHKLQHHEV